MTSTPPIESIAKPLPEKLEILYQDQSIIAVAKPSGLLVHKSPIDKNETRYAMKLLRDQIGQWVYPVHRLDKPTSGVLVFALDPETASEIGQQFTDHKVSKEYLAIVRGFPKSEGVIDHALKEIAAFKSEQAKADLKIPQKATTSYETINTYELPFSDGRFATSRYAAVKLMPITGRKHQLRRHLKHISHPIVGDVKYGKGEHNRLFRENFDCHRLLLACTRMQFTHPRSGKILDINCPLEPSFQACILALNPYVISNQNHPAPI